MAKNDFYMADGLLHPVMWHDHDTVAGGCVMTCHRICPNVCHIGILHLVSISTHHHSRHVILYQSAKFFSKSDHPRQKKMTSSRFSRWQISAILDFRDPIMGSLKSPCRTSYKSSIENIALNCFVLRKLHFFAFWRQTD